MHTTRFAIMALGCLALGGAAMALRAIEHAAEQDASLVSELVKARDTVQELRVVSEREARKAYAFILSDSNDALVEQALAGRLGAAMLTELQERAARLDDAPMRRRLDEIEAARAGYDDALAAAVAARRTGMGAEPAYEIYLRDSLDRRDASIANFAQAIERRLTRARGVAAVASERAHVGLATARSLALVAAGWAGAAAWSLARRRIGARRIQRLAPTWVTQDARPAEKLRSA